MKNAYNVLIFGASYGSLLATKLVLAGHNAKMVCTPAEAELFNREGAIVRMPVKGREGLVEISSLNGSPRPLIIASKRDLSSSLMLQNKML